jgi:hypothetical protein
MPKTKISEFDVDPANNTDINSINIAEGCAPSGINNAIRQLMSDLKEQLTGASGDPFTVGGAFAANGGATLGDASGDALTINSSAVSIPNGLNFDSNTFVIDATNNYVGIGTASPIAKLDVVGSAGVTSFTGTTRLGLTVRGSTSTNDYSGIDFTGTSITQPTARIAVLSGTSGSSLQFGTSNLYTSGITNTAMTIDSSGNVGIGTSSPTYKLTLAATNPRVSLEATGGTYYTRLVASSSFLYSGIEYASVFNFVDGSTERMRITSAGDVAIGATSTSGYKLAVSDGTTYSVVHAGGGASYYGAITNNPVLFITNNTERMRIDSSGNLLVGTTSILYSSGQNGLSVKTTGGYAIATQPATNNYNALTTLNASGTLVGSIYVSSTATAYNTSSDYRLKENIAPMTGSGAFIDALKPKTWTWTADGSTGVGFIAHEVQEVSPNSVVGEKDAVDEKGKPKYQAMEYGSAEFIANIIAELQDLRKRVATLESK